MNYTKLIEKIEQKIEYKPKQAELCRILNVSTSAMARRCMRDSSFSDDEIKKIEAHYGIMFKNNSANNVEIDYFEDVYASCGRGAAVFSESKDKISVPMAIIKNYNANYNYSVINSRGDSMTPYIQDNDKLIIEHWAGSQIIDNRVYVFSYDNEIFVKRLVKNITQIVIKSDNPSYNDIKIEGTDKKFKLIGQIVGLMRDMR